MKEIVKKEVVEKRIGYEITDKQFGDALKYAENKQEQIYQREKRPVVLQNQYFAKLIEEYVRSLIFSKFTMDLCRTLHDMEKEHPVIDKSAPHGYSYCSSSCSINQVKNYNMEDKIYE